MSHVIAIDVKHAAALRDGLKQQPPPPQPAHA